MAFREKSAWVMAAITLVAGLFYVRTSLAYPGSPVQETVMPYVLLVVVLSVVAQVILALRSPKEASAPADERERLVIQKSGHWSGIVLVVGIVLAGGVYILAPDGNMLFHRIMFALIGAQLVQYAVQITLLRRAV
jgi:hypothetical protein